MRRAILISILLGIGVFSRCQAVELTASWYSEESLKKEGTWKTSKGVMANGKRFDESAFTCATRLFPLGSYVRVVVCESKGKGAMAAAPKGRRNGEVVVKVTDRIGKRFAQTRIDLSKAAFEKIAPLNKGIVPVTVELIE